MLNYHHIIQRVDQQRAEDLLRMTNESFSPSLDTQVDINEYSSKLAKYANFLLIYSAADLVGVVAYYENREVNEIYISHIATLPNYKHQGVGTYAISILNDIYSEMRGIRLEVRKDNIQARSFYSNHGFIEEVSCCLESSSKVMLFKRW